MPKDWFDTKEISKRKGSTYPYEELEEYKPSKVFKQLEKIHPFTKARDARRRIQEEDPFHWGSFEDETETKD